jgi:hypothetical protein
MPGSGDDGGQVLMDGGDGSPLDGPQMDGGASSCHPGSSQFYKPEAGSYRPATGLYQGKCVPEQIAGFYDACLGPKRTKMDCDAVVMDAGVADCVACIITPDTAARYGPIVQHGSVAEENLAGCIELLDPANYKCCEEVQQAVNCDVAVCSANCPVTDQTSFNAYSDCVTQADQTVCSTYSMRAQCASAEADGGASLCIAGSFQEFYDNVVPIFCGVAGAPDAGGTPDAGAD